MRYAPGSPDGVIDYLLSEIMLWASQSGFAWFDLGVAPLTHDTSYPCDAAVIAADVARLIGGGARRMAVRQAADGQIAA